MRRRFRRCVAALVGAVMVATPGRVWAQSSFQCPTFKMVASHSTGGDWIAGLLMYQTDGSVTRTEATTSTTTTTSSNESVNSPIAAASVGASTTVTTTNTGGTVTTKEPFGYYAMNDGTTWQINCLNGEGRQI